MNHDDMPEMTCPKCRPEEPDLDGFGMLACPACKWCSHPSRDGGRCNICGDEERGGVT